MAEFIVINTHSPEECEASFKAYEEAQKTGLSPLVKGLTSYCSCPYGEHASWTAMQAETAEEVLSSLWPFEREHSRVVEVQGMTIE